MIRGDEDITEGLLNAFRLEKGAQAFYAAAADRMPDQGAAEMFRKLASVEDKHMQAIYNLYNSFLGDRGPLGFEEFKQKIKAEFTESGKIIETAVSDASGRFFMDRAEVLRVALDEELSAQERYRRMADAAEDPATAALYRDLASEEEAHIALIRKAMQ